MTTPIDIFDILSDTREGRQIGFQTILDRLSRQQRSPVTQFNRPFVSNLFPSLENEFFGALGNRISQGQEPITFTDFLNNDFNLQRRIRRTPSQQVGSSISRLTSPARFLFSQ